MGARRENQWEVLSTSRLLLRRPRPGDAEELYAGVTSDALVARLVGWPRHTDVETTRRVLEGADAYWEANGIGPFVVLDASDRHIMGTTGLTRTGEREASTGYVLARTAWGQGFASEALAEMVRLASSMGIQRLSAFVHPENTKSVRVLKKANFELEATEREEHFPNLGAGITCAVLDYARAL